MLMAKDSMGDTVLVAAATPGDIKYFKDVIICLTGYLGPDKVWTHTE